MKKLLVIAASTCLMFVPTAVSAATSATCNTTGPGSQTETVMPIDQAAGLDAPLTDVVANSETTTNSETPPTSDGGCDVTVDNNNTCTSTTDNNTNVDNTNNQNTTTGDGTTTGNTTGGNTSTGDGTATNTGNTNVDITNGNPCNPTTPTPTPGQGGGTTTTTPVVTPTVSTPAVQSAATVLPDTGNTSNAVIAAFSVLGSGVMLASYAGSQLIKRFLA